MCKYEVLMSLRCLRLSLCLSDTNQLLSLSDRGWGKNVGFKHRCQFGRGMGGRFSPYSSMCRKTDPLLPRAQSASLPYVRLIDVWLSDCIEIQILSTGAFRYGSTLAFTPAPRITHTMDWFEHQIEPKLMFTELLTYRTEFCLFDITGCNLKSITGWHVFNTFAKQVTIALHLSALKVFIVECFTLFLHITKRSLSLV